MSLTLYSHPLSLFSAKVRIALAEKGMPCLIENVPLDRTRGYQPKHPEVVRHNPKQQVPVLLDGDLVLYDSTVILEYLEDLAPEPELYPRDPRERARCRLLELEADELCFMPIQALIQQRYALASGSAEDPAVRARAASAFTANCQHLARRLGEAAFLCERFGAADIAHFLVATFAQGFGLAFPPSLPALQKWFGRVASRPAVAAELGSIVQAARQFGVSPNVSAPAAAAP